MKIAVITDNGSTISQHFGRAAYYAVLTIQDGKVTARELRSKLGHSHVQGEHATSSHEEHRGMDAASHDRHTQMASAISDCQVVICGGMGMGAYESMRRLNIQPVVTDEREIDTAVQAYLAGQLVDHTEKLH